MARVTDSHGGHYRAMVWVRQAMARSAVARGVNELGHHRDGECSYAYPWASSQGIVLGKQRGNRLLLTDHGGYLLATVPDETVRVRP